MSALSRDVVVVGASAGGVEALRAVVAGLPADLPASMLVVLHLPAGGTSALPAILSRAGSLPACPRPTASCRGTVASTSRHRTVTCCCPSSGWRSPRHRRVAVIARPSTCCQSAAVGFGRRVVGVVLSGSLCDGEWRERALSVVFTCPACAAPLVDLGRQAMLICRAGPPVGPGDVTGDEGGLVRAGGADGGTGVPGTGQPRSQARIGRAQPRADLVAGAVRPAESGRRAFPAPAAHPPGGRTFRVIRVRVPPTVRRPPARR